MLRYKEKNRQQFFRQQREQISLNTVGREWCSFGGMVGSEDGKADPERRVSVNLALHGGMVISCIWEWTRTWKCIVSTSFTIQLAWFDRTGEVVLGVVLRRGGEPASQGGADVKVKEH